MEMSFLLPAGPQDVVDRLREGRFNMAEARSPTSTRKLDDELSERGLGPTRQRAEGGPGASCRTFVAASSCAYNVSLQLLVAVQRARRHRRTGGFGPPPSRAHRVPRRRVLTPRPRQWARTRGRPHDTAVRWPPNGLVSQAMSASMSVVCLGLVRISLLWVPFGSAEKSPLTAQACAARGP